jgi:hypothetical protein
MGLTNSVKKRLYRLRCITDYLKHIGLRPGVPEVTDDSASIHINLRIESQSKLVGGGSRATHSSCVRDGHCPLGNHALSSAVTYQLSLLPRKGMTNSFELDRCQLPSNVTSASNTGRAMELVCEIVRESRLSLDEMGSRVRVCRLPSGECQTAGTIVFDSLSLLAAPAGSSLSCCTATCAANCSRCRKSLLRPSPPRDRLRR